MVGWHHQLDEHEFEQAPGVGDGQTKKEGEGGRKEVGKKGEGGGKEAGLELHPGVEDLRQGKDFHT